MGNLKEHFNKNWKNYLIGILLIIVLFNVLIGGLLSMGTSNFGSQKSLNYEAQYDRAGSSYYYDSGNDALGEEERKVIKNANLDLETKNFDKAKEQIQSSIDAHDATILSQSQNTYSNDYKRIYYTIKVDSQKLDIFLDEIKTYAEVERINIYSNDVTGTYADYSDRLQRYQTQIQAYEAMLLRKDLEVEDEIQIQNRIDQLEDGIFSLQKRVTNIDEDVAYSQVQISLREEQSVLSELDFLGLKDGFKLFLESLEAGIKFILTILGFILPFAIIYAIYRGIKKLVK
jgi:hypothetical protein